MNDSVTLSILIPSYNHAHFIVNTLNSHLESNPFSYEIIIIDDGSKDNSVQVIKDWINQHPEVEIKLISRENRGVTATLNELIDLSRGKFIRLFASDDLSYSNANKDLVDFLEKSDCDAVFGYARVIDDAGTLVHSNSIEFLGRHVRDYQMDLKRSVILKWAIVGPSLMLRRTVFGVIGKFDEKSLIEDWYLYLNLISQCKVGFHNHPVADYRIHASNASRTNDRARRIKNYASQIMSGEACLKHFSGNQKYMLQAEISYLSAKKCLAGRDFIKCFLYLVKYTYFYFRSL